MPNDVLGQFPSPTGLPSSQDQSASPSQSDLQNPSTSSVPFEPTPDEIPSPISSNPITPSSEYSPPAQIDQPVFESPPPPAPGSDFVVSSVPEPEPVSPVFTAPPANEPVLATTPPAKSGSAFRAFFVTVLFFTTLASIAGAYYLYQQTTTLRSQLTDLIENSSLPQPIITPNTPSDDLTASSSITPLSTLPTATPSISIMPVSETLLKPLFMTPEIIRIASDFQPNAQFILLKTDNVENTSNIVSKYFFRYDNNTKKYFYVLVNGTSQPEIISKSIQVTPDNNIPSLNNLSRESKLGLDLDEALKLVYSKCSDLTICQAASTKAQYIQTQNGVIWQISLFVPEKAQPMVMQINAQTKIISFRTADFIQD